MANKRAAEMSLNTIVVAAIVLITLIVVVMIFTGRFGEFNRQIGDCKAKGGEPMGKDNCVNSGGVLMEQIYDEKGEPTGEWCCST